NFCPKNKGKDVMDTSRSEKMTSDFLARNQPFKREIITFERRFHAPAKAVFPQLCPSREADWFDLCDPGLLWKADLIWTTTGYAEADCVYFTAPESTIGPGLWVFTKREPNRLLEAIRVIAGLAVSHVRVELTDRGDGTCDGVWTFKFTALSEQGNAFVESLPHNLPPFDRALEGLDRFVSGGGI
ncbi:MAG: hypothetical protein MI741_14670, partial [Rhodospirillales bacterium]|nr:hypothetical protein [Rhodospirillales bacterium]